MERLPCGNGCCTALERCYKVCTRADAACTLLPRRSNPPLIIRGPGAGPAVTAAGVFADLITLARYLGAPS
jgi:homoserine dehydrogenase